MIGRLFTPRHAVTDERLQLTLGPDDAALIKRGLGWRATVTDEETGARWLAWGAACSAPRCFCDALAIEVDATQTGKESP